MSRRRPSSLAVAHRWALSAMLAACWLLAPSVAASADAAPTAFTGKVMATVTRAVALPFTAIVDEVLVKPGDALKEGNVLLRYHLQEEAGRLLQREVTTGAATEDLKGRILDMRRQLAEITAERNKVRKLVDSGLGAKQALSRLEDDVESIEARIQLLRSTVAKNQRIFEGRLRELEGYYGVPLKEGQELPHMLELRSPIDGYVLSLASTLNPGVELPAGATPITVGQLNPVLIEVPVYEGDLGSIRSGDKAQVEIPSLGNKRFTGTVNEVSWVSSDMNIANPSYYAVELEVPNASLELKPGFKAVVYFAGATARK